MLEMPWGQLVLTLQAVAESYEDDHVETNPKKVTAFFGQ